MPATAQPILPADITGYSLTEQVNELTPFKLRLATLLGLSWTSSRDRTLKILRVRDEVRMLDPKSLDELGPALKKKSGKTLTVEAPYFPAQTTIRPRDLQGIMPRPGQQVDERAMLEDVVIERVVRLEKSYGITEEKVLFNMVTGQLETVDGTTNLYTALGVSKKVVDFKFSDDAFDVLGACAQVRNHIEDNIGDDMVSGVHMLVSDEFFAKLTAHPKVEKAYERYQQGAMLRDGFGTAFTFGQITFERYEKTYTDSSGNPQKFIATGKGHAFPTGTHNTFDARHCPAEINEYVNTPGIRLYVTREDLPHGKGVEIHTESHPLAVCKRPEVLIEVTNS